MIRRSGIASACIAMVLSLGAAPVSAQGSMSVDDTALCSAALKLAQDNLGNSLSQRAKFIEMSNWFGAKGREMNDTIFAQQYSIYTAAFEDARENGDPQFGSSVTGCQTYFETANSD